MTKRVFAERRPLQRDFMAPIAGDSAGKSGSMRPATHPEAAYTSSSNTVHM